MEKSLGRVGERKRNGDRQREDLFHHSKGKYFSPFKVPGWHSGKESPSNAEDSRDTGSIPGSGRCPGVGNGNPPQYSCQKNSMDREAWLATVLGVAKSQTQKLERGKETKSNYFSLGKRSLSKLFSSSRGKARAGGVCSSCGESEERRRDSLPPQSTEKYHQVNKKLEWHNTGRDFSEESGHMGKSDIVNSR